MGAARELSLEMNGPGPDGLPASLLAFWTDVEKEEVRKLGKAILTAQTDYRKLEAEEMKLEQRAREQAKAVQAQRQREVDKVLGERDDGVTEIPLVESRSEVLQAALGRIRRNMKESLENEKELEGQRRGLIFDANWRAELKLYGMLEETMRRGRALYVLVSAADMFRASSGSTEGGLNHATWQQTTVSAQPHMASGYREPRPQVFSRDVLLHGPNEMPLAARVAQQCKWDIEKELCPAGATVDLSRKG